MKKRLIASVLGGLLGALLGAILIKGLFFAPIEDLALNAVLSGGVDTNPISFALSQVGLKLEVGAILGAVAGVLLARLIVKKPAPAPAAA